MFSDKSNTFYYSNSQVSFNCLPSVNKLSHNKNFQEKVEKTVTPYYHGETRRSFYDRVNTSPVKVKYSTNTEDAVKKICCDGEKTITKKVNSSNPFNNNVYTFGGKENDILTTNLDYPMTSCYNSKSDTQPKQITLVKGNNFKESKPHLNCLESRNNLYAYSKSKKYIEDPFSDEDDNFSVLSENSKYFQNTQQMFKEKEYAVANSNDNEGESNINGDKKIDENEEDNLDDYARRLLELEKQLPIPINKKDDEKFKILKMKGMKKKSMPSYKSVRASDADLLPTHVENLNTGKLYF